MAKKASRHGRTLIVFLLAVLAMYAGLALNNDWSPKLGLDLQGGTRITLEASTETGEEITGSFRAPFCGEAYSGLYYVAYCKP